MAIGLGAATLIGGGMAGLGGIGNAFIARKTSRDNMRRQQRYDKELMGMQQRYDSAQADKAFAHDRSQSEAAFAHDRSQSELAFAHDKAQQAEAFEFNREENRAAFEHDKSQAELAWEREVEMWNMQNEYNDPSSQMERLKAAGLNPHLVYGNGVTGNNASSAPSYNAASYTPAQKNAASYDKASYQGAKYSPVRSSVPRTNVGIEPLMFDFSSVGRTIQQYADVQLKQAQIDNVKAATENVEAKTLSEVLGFEGVDADSGLKKQAYFRAKELLDTDVETGKVKLHQLKTQIKNTEADTKLKEINQLIQSKEAEWRKKGMTQNDALWLRKLYEAKEFLEKKMDNIKNPALNWFNW